MKPTLSNIDELLADIRVLRERRDFRRICALLAPLPRAEVLAEPQLAIALAASLSFLREHARAKAALEEMRNYVSNSSDLRFRSRWHLLLAIQLIDEGALPDAEDSLAVALDGAERLKDQHLIADANNSVGVICGLRGLFDLAGVHFRRSLLAWQTLGSSQGVGICEFNLGLALRESGRPLEALPHYQAADEYFRREGIEEERIHLRAERAILFRDLGDLALAAELARSAVHDSEHLSATSVRAAALRAQAAILRSSGSTRGAREVLYHALGLLRSSPAGVLRSEILDELCFLELAQGDKAAAAARYGDAVEAYMRLGCRDREADLSRRYHNS